MPSTQDIRRRIKSIKSIQQITKAMKMVAAARLRKAQERAIASRPFTEKIRQVMTSVAHNARDVSHSLLTVREVKRTAYIILSSDKGLAGAYSTNVIKEALAHMQSRDNTGFITVGRKARDYFKRRNFPVDAEYSGFSEKPTYMNAVEIAQHIADSFIVGDYDEVFLAYTQFISPINQRPEVIRLLPIDSSSDDASAKHEYIFEPSAPEVLSVLLPRYLETVLYGALLQAAASELGARMTAMESATDNAEELISKLVLNYNKVRQATITREISEIVGGAEALK